MRRTSDQQTGAREVDGTRSGRRLVTLEYSPEHAAVARANLVRAGLEDVVEGRVRRALDALSTLAGEPFDLVFVDADRAPYAQYLDWAARLTRVGGLIVGDNVVRRGRVLEAGADADSAGVRTFLEVLPVDPRVDGTVLQTVGAKGWDGIAVAVRVSVSGADCSWRSHLVRRAMAA